MNKPRPNAAQSRPDLPAQRQRLAVPADLHALLAQRPGLVAAALASPVNIGQPLDDATRRRYGITLAAQLYPGNIAAQLAVEAIIGELRLKPGNPKLPKAVALLAGQKDAARRHARWLVGVLRVWPRADVGFDLARFYPERRAALAGHDSAPLTEDECRARAVLLDAAIDREKLRRARLTLAQHADATQDHERLARNLARVLSFAGQRCRDARFCEFCRRHYAKLIAMTDAGRFAFAKAAFADLRPDPKGEKSTAKTPARSAKMSFQRAWRTVAKTPPTP